MLKDKRIERRVKARMQAKIEDAQTKYDEERRRILDSGQVDRQRAYEDYLDTLTAIRLRESGSLEKLEEECVNEACTI